MPRVISIPATPSRFKQDVQALLGEIEDWSKIRYWVLYAWNRGIRELFKDPTLTDWDPHDPVTTERREKRRGYYANAPERGASRYTNLWRGKLRDELSLQRSLSRAKLRGLSERFRPFSISTDLARISYAGPALKLRPFSPKLQRWVSLQVDQYVNYQLLKNYQRLTGG